MEIDAPPSVQTGLITIPLFPLNAVLFPGGALPLRIFEPRYLDMVSKCLRTDTGIGVVLIKNGDEIGTAAEPHSIGTLCEISYWNRRTDGLLGVTLRGQQRFLVHSHWVEPNQLLMAEVEVLEPMPELELPKEYHALEVLLRRIMAQLGPPHTTLPEQYTEAGWVCARLTELLPLPLDEKQAILHIADPQARLRAVGAAIARLNLNG